MNNLLSMSKHLLEDSKYQQRKPTHYKIICEICGKEFTALTKTAKKCKAKECQNEYIRRRNLNNR